MEISTQFVKKSRDIKRKICEKILFVQFSVTGAREKGKGVFKAVSPLPGSELVSLLLIIADYLCKILTQERLFWRDFNFLQKIYRYSHNLVTNRQRNHPLLSICWM